MTSAYSKGNSIARDFVQCENFQSHTISWHYFLYTIKRMTEIMQNIQVDWGLENFLIGDCSGTSPCLFADSSVARSNSKYRSSHHA